MLAKPVDRAYFCGSEAVDGGGVTTSGGVRGVRAGGMYGSSMALANSRTTVLLARRNSRSTLPAVRIASGSFSGGITMTATKRNRRISKMTRPSANYWWRANPIEPAQPFTMIIDAPQGVKR
jgi:hypothetical protein